MTRRESVAANATKRTCLVVCALVYLANPGFAAVSNVVVSGVTNTQALLQYTAPDYNACTVEVSESPAYAPLDFDVDAAKFANASTDLMRPSTVVTGKTRMVVLGRRVAAHALDGWVRSRALQQNAAHYYRITCGSDVATGAFNTVPIPLGNTNNEPIPGDPTDPENPLWPQLDFRDRTQTVIDPQTGVLIKLLSFPGEAPFGVANPQVFSYSYAPSWTNGTLGNTGSGPGASISGSSAILALVIDAGYSFSAINVQITCAIAGGATGNDAMGQIAISRNGTTPYGPWRDFTCPSTLSTTQTVGDSITPNTTNSAGYMPTWINADAGQRPIPWPVDPGPISITVSGAAVSNPTTSTQGFNPFSTAGQIVYINNGGGFLPYAVSSITDFHHLTMKSTITGSSGGNPVISSISVAYPGIITTATPHGFLTGDTVSTIGVAGFPPTIVWTANVLSPTTLTLAAGGAFLDGHSVTNCCAGASLAVAPAIDLPSLYFVVRKKTASANTMNFRAQYSVLPEDPIVFNGGSGGLEHCPPRGIPDGMYINSIDSSGQVTFAQPTHGFTIGSSIAITLGGTVPVSVDGNYTANIIDNAHAQINSWSHGAWSGDGYMFQPGAKIGYLCWILTGGGASLMQNIFTDGEVRNLGALYLANSDISSTPSSVFSDVTKNTYLTYLRAYTPSSSGGVMAGVFWPRTRDVGQNFAGYSPPWTSIATHVQDAITAFDPRVGVGVNPCCLVNGSYFVLSGTYASQDSSAWTVVLNNAGVPVATDSSFSTPPTRFAGQHGIGGARKDNLIIRSFHGAYHYSNFPYNGSWTFTLASTMNGPPFDDCGMLAPGNILTAAPFPATGLHCTLVTVNTTTPAAATPPGEHLGGALKVGDMVDGQGENLRVVAVPDSTHVVFQRRFSVDHYNATSCSQVGLPADCSWTHAIGTVFEMLQGESDYATATYHGDYGALAWWDFIADPFGLNAADPAGQGLSTATKYFESAFPTASHFDWKDHIFLNDSGGDVTVGWPLVLPSNGKVDGIRLCPSSNQRVGCQPVFVVNGNPGFSGLAGAAGGNYGDQHPSIMSPDPAMFPNDPVTNLPKFPFYSDFQTMGVVSDGASHIAALAPGAAQVYKFSSGSSIEDSPDNKRLPLTVTSGGIQVADVSAPGRMLADNATDQYHGCNTVVPGECWAGSGAGDRYANIPYAVVHPLNGNFGCFDTRILDVCSWMLGAHQGRFSQLGMQRQDRFGNDSRSLTWGLEYSRRSGGNTRVLPSGDWEIISGTAGSRIGTMLLAKIGTFPAYSSVNRTDFISVPIQIPSKPGAAAAVIDYGFDENFRCTSRADGCVANGNAPTAPNPFYWASETYTGAPCTSGCKINIPAIGGRMVYYRTRYLNSSGATVLTGKTAVIAVP
jgi:hypothetical protein